MNRPEEKPVLFRRYPALAERIPWMALGSFPTPVQRLDRIGPGGIWIKRDDLSSQIYGGNKVRKLEYILADARRKKMKRIVTMGGIGTNHGLATVIFSRRLQIDCKLLLFRQPVTRNVRQNLLLFHRYGAATICRRSLWGTVLDFYLWQRLRHPGAYFLFAGGSTPLGTVGFVNAVFELKDQIEKGEMPEPERIFCTLGSNGTLAGLCLGAALAGLKSKITGVRVTASHLGPFQASTPQAVDRLIAQTHRLLRACDPEIPDADVTPPTIVDDYFGGAYGRVTESGRAAYRRMAETEGIHLDPTYTAKTFAAVIDHCERGGDAPVLYWHTYNAVDLSAEAAAVDRHSMPKALQEILAEKEIAFP